jgi:hypothetical protein
MERNNLTDVMAQISARTLSLVHKEPNDQKLGKRVRQLVNETLKQLKERNGLEDIHERVK